MYAASKKMLLRAAYRFFRRDHFFDCVSTCLSSRSLLVSAVTLHHASRV